MQLIKIITIFLLFGSTHNSYTLDLLNTALWNYFTHKAQKQLLSFFSARVDYYEAQSFSQIMHEIDPVLLSIILTEKDFNRYPSNLQKEKYDSFMKEYKIFDEGLENANILTKSGYKALTELFDNQDKNLSSTVEKLFKKYKKMRELESIFDINEDN